jgi:16S rRNA (guanine527-N7)-methyltransferase
MVGLELDGRVAERMLGYFELLRRWNRHLNLTGLQVEDVSDESIDRLLVEPTLASRSAPAVESVIDVGSGGGSPAIPFALGWTPNPMLTLVESRSRKCTFLREALREVGLSGRVVSGRFEDLAKRPEEAGRYEALTIRAVRTEPGLWESAHRVLTAGGRVYWFHGEGQDLPAEKGLIWSSPTPLVPTLRSVLSVGTRH